MLKLLIYMQVAVLCLLVSCSSPQEKLEGSWVVSSIQPIATQLSSDDLESLNALVCGLEYTFRNDSTFVNDSLVGIYVADASNVTLSKTDGETELYGYRVSDDSLSIDNDMFVLKMNRLEE